MSTPASAIAGSRRPSTSGARRKLTGPVYRGGRIGSVDSCRTHRRVARDRSIASGQPQPLDGFNVGINVGFKGAKAAPPGGCRVLQRRGATTMAQLMPQPGGAQAPYSYSRMVDIINAARSGVVSSRVAADDASPLPPPPL